MSTLRESAEKIVAEAFPCSRQRDRHPMPCSSLYPAALHYGDCPANRRDNALSAVLAGMRLVLQGTPHLHGNTTDPRQATMQCDRKGGWENCPYHSPTVCARLGGACRLRELE